MTQQRDTLTYDVAIIGGGPAGLAAAIRFRQLDTEKKFTICVIEKAAQLGGHTLAGAVLEPRALDELLPTWRDQHGFEFQPVTADQFLFLSDKKQCRLPTPPQMHNKGNGIVSISQFVRFLGQQAESLGVDVLPGFAAHEMLQETGQITGVRTGDFGREKDGSEGPGFTPGPDIQARLTLLAEGCRGHLTKTLIKPFKLDENRCPQTYAQGVKEVWRVKPEKHKPGLVQHTLGWPLDTSTYGGGWIYHYGDGKVSLGFVTGLDYADSATMPTSLMQRFKTHPLVADLLDGAELLAAGARALYEGGLQAQYKLAIPGALLLGDAAGTLNVPKIKGIHTAMKSGMLAAETAHAYLSENKPLQAYEHALANSWLGKELHQVRNIRPGFQYGMWLGLANAALETITLGKLPWTLKHKRPDHAALHKVNGPVTPMDFAKGPLTIDRLTGVSLTHTAHNEAQPVHLKIADPDICTSRCTAEYANPCTRFCPAGVYEMVAAEDGKAKLQINSANCIHCKTCDIKDPYQVITWVTPEGGSGPNYTEM